MFHIELMSETPTVNRNAMACERFTCPSDLFPVTREKRKLQCFLESL